MSSELDLSFPDRDHFAIALDGDRTDALPFESPITPRDLRQLAWYLETYGAHSLGDPDDQEAKRIAASLPAWGKALFDAVFATRPAQRLFNRFQDDERDTRLLTISAAQPAILGLPWELLHDSSPGGVFLFNEQPGVSIRRRVVGVTGGRPPFEVKPKDRLHLLFVVSRPADSGFLDPRADMAAVLDALDEHASATFSTEVLRPPTLDALTRRLRDKSQPAVDVIHFDGHGVFDTRGGLPERVRNRSLSMSALLSGGTLKEEPGVDLESSSPPNCGYLVFETPDGQPDLVSAEMLGFNLHRQRVPLVVLSACQSAAQGESDDPMGSVAARLTAAGIPAVLAMSHSVLVPTTQALFGEFYGALASRSTLGEALDSARLHLFNHPEKYEVQRGQARIPLKLYDWFVPTLYQAGSDAPLIRLAKSGRPTPAPVSVVRTNIPPPPEAGFYGRRRELWHIERWFADRTRRLSIVGYGGQGKTALALEAARWLTRIGMFRAAVLVDYSRIEADDAVVAAVGNIGTVLDQTLLDADSARQALAQTPTLLVLDNLETLSADALSALLEAAEAWSTAGGTRVLLTSRNPDLGHQAYRSEGTLLHRQLVLSGLGSAEAPDDALEWFARLSKLPPPPVVGMPKREALIELFDKVRFHPLSIGVLAQQLKTRRPAELGSRLEQLLASAAATRSTAADATVPELVASLNLSLERLDPRSRELLPRLGVFEGGGFEDDIVAITGQAAAEELTFAEVWPGLRQQLEAGGLIQVETVRHVRPPYIRFHPTLAPMCWSRLTPEAQAALVTSHQEYYPGIAAYLQQLDARNPQAARAIALRDLPNLLRAVYAGFDANAPGAHRMANHVAHFLNLLGRAKEAQRLDERVAAASVEQGTTAWYFAESQRGEAFHRAGQYRQAREVFTSILTGLDSAKKYERAAIGRWLGRTLADSGQTDLAIKCIREALAEAEPLDPSQSVKGLRAALYNDLGDALRDSGAYAEARAAYETSRQRSADDPRNEGVVLGQLGSLALLEHNLGEALERYLTALELFERLNEPAMQQVYHHQLGHVYLELGELDESERHFREAARLCEQLGMIGGTQGAAATWAQVAIVNERAGRPESAERWYRKAIEAFRQEGEPALAYPALNNIALMLSRQVGRLSEARAFAEEALAFQETLDPNSAPIWQTLGVLAQINRLQAATSPSEPEQVALRAQAREYGRRGREAMHKFAGSAAQLTRHLPLILLVIDAARRSTTSPELGASLAQLEQRGWTNLVAAIYRILAGERDVEVLYDELDMEDSLIVETLLAGLRDPAVFEDLLSRARRLPE